MVRLTWLLRQERTSSENGIPAPEKTDHEPSRESRSANSRTPWALPHLTTIVSGGHDVGSRGSTGIGFLRDWSGTVRLPLRGRAASSDDQRRRGIATMRDADVDSCVTDAGRSSEGLTRQRPVALSTVAVF